MEAQNNPGGKILLRLAISFIGLATIAPLLGYLYGIAPMPTLALWLLLPAIIIFALVYVRAFLKKDRDLCLRFERGLLGGLLGIVGYDLVRVPIHHSGYNPFSAIQSYGVYLTGADHSTLFSDLAGIIYHTGNGIFFALTFTLLIGPGKKTPLLAMLWALILEGFAVLTIFGVIYHLRDHPKATALAFFAHLFYGAPLAWAAMKKRILPAHWTVTVVSLLATLVTLFFLMRPPDSYQNPGPGVVEILEGGLHSRWTRTQVQQPVEIRNSTDKPVTVEVSSESIAPLIIPPNETKTTTINEPGIFQLRARTTAWRSVFLIVEKNGYLIPSR